MGGGGRLKLDIFNYGHELGAGGAGAEMDIFHEGHELCSLATKREWRHDGLKGSLRSSGSS